MPGKFLIHGDAGQVVGGNVFHFHVPRDEQSGPAVVIDEVQFFNATRMRASAPARVALLRLLEEDVTSRALSIVWGDEFTFEEPEFRLRVNRWVPWMLVSLVVLLLISGTAFAIEGNSSPAGWLMGMLLGGLTTMFCWTLVEFYRPYLVVRRLVPMVERVNQELPGLLAEWRRGIRG
jgi:hypothetical protein